jgi:hypothetical protein
MAKKGKSVSDRLGIWRAILEDVTESNPQFLSDFFYDGTATKRSPALLKAAAYFKLDLSSEIDTYRLLHILAEVAFPSKGRKQGSMRWGIGRLKELGAHWREIERTNPGISDSKAAKEIKRRYPKLYQSGAVQRYGPVCRMRAL